MAFPCTTFCHVFIHRPDPPFTFFFLLKKRSMHFFFDLQFFCFRTLFLSLNFLYFFSLQKEVVPAMDAAASLQLVYRGIDPVRFSFPRSNRVSIRTRTRPVLAVATEPKPTRNGPSQPSPSINNTNGSSKPLSSKKSVNGVSTVKKIKYVHIAVGKYLFFFGEMSFDFIQSTSVCLLRN